MAATKRQVHLVAVLNNSLAAVLLATLIALGVYVNIKKFILGDLPTKGWQTLGLDTTYWNVACTIVGTTVGLIAAVGFANQDDNLTRHELASQRGVVAMFLRPLTIMRGAEQLFRLQFPFERTILVVLLMVTALTSAAVVALFSIHASTEEIINPRPSFPLEGLDGTYFANDNDGSLKHGSLPFYLLPSNQLSGFLYKSAFITGLKTKDEYYGATDPNMIYMPEQGSLGDTMYGTLNTGGVGLNASSYLQFSGLADGFNMPSKYTFNMLSGTIYGTNVEVTCKNVTADYSNTQTLARENNGGQSQIETLSVARPSGPNFTFYNSLGFVPQPRSLVITSTVTIEQASDLPIHSLAITGSLQTSAFVMECLYEGQDYLAEVSLNSSVSALEIGKRTESGSRLDTLWKQKVANFTDDLVSYGGGNLARGFKDAEFNVDGDNNTDMMHAVETVFSQLGEAYFSILRQTIERSNIHTPGDSIEENGSRLRILVTVQRLGGAQYGWLAVLGILLLGTLMGVFRACASGRAIEYEAQDVVKLLRSGLKIEGMHDTARVQYGDGITLLGRDEPPEQREEKVEAEGGDTFTARGSNVS